MDWTEDAVGRIYELVGPKIRAVRLKRGWNQADLARQVGLTRSSIANVEAGRQRLLIHSLFAIANTLDVEIDTLLPTSLEVDELMHARHPAPDLSGQPDSAQNFVKATIRRASEGSK